MTYELIRDIVERPSAYIPFFTILLAGGTILWYGGGTEDMDIIERIRDRVRPPDRRTLSR